MPLLQSVDENFVHSPPLRRMPPPSTSSSEGFIPRKLPANMRRHSENAKQYEERIAPYSAPPDSISQVTQGYTGQQIPRVRQSQHAPHNSAYFRHYKHLTPKSVPTLSQLRHDGYHNKRRPSHVSSSGVSITSTRSTRSSSNSSYWILYTKETLFRCGEFIYNEIVTDTQFDTYFDASGPKKSSRGKKRDYLDKRGLKTFLYHVISCFVVMSLQLDTPKKRHIADLLEDVSKEVFQKLGPKKRCSRQWIIDNLPDLFKNLDIGENESQAQVASLLGSVEREIGAFKNQLESMKKKHRDAMYDLHKSIKLIQSMQAPPLDSMMDKLAREFSALEHTYNLLEGRLQTCMDTQLELEDETNQVWCQANSACQDEWEEDIPEENGFDILPVSFFLRPLGFTVSLHPDGYVFVDDVEADSQADKLQVCTGWQVLLVGDVDVPEDMVEMIESAPCPLRVVFSLAQCEM